MQTAPVFCFQFREAEGEPDIPNQCNSLGNVYTERVASTRETQHVVVQCVNFLTARFVYS